MTLREQRLEALLREALEDVFESSYSGYIPGCGEDLKWDKRKQEWEIEARAVLAEREQNAAAQEAPIQHKRRASQPELAGGNVPASAAPEENELAALRNKLETAETIAHRAEHRANQAESERDELRAKLSAMRTLGMARQ